MSAARVAEVQSERGFLATPLREETGTAYRYALLLPNRDLLFADTLTDLVTGLIPGHDSLDFDAGIEARIRYCAHAAAMLQAHALTAAPEDELDALDSEELAALLAPRIGQFAAQAPWWRPSVPLYVVETSYIPFTDLPRPASIHDGVPGAEDTVVWLRPVDPELMVLSLHEAGFVRVLVNDDREDAIY